MKIEPLSESEELALREMLKRQNAKRIIQHLVDDGRLVRLPNGRIIEREKLTPEHRREIDKDNQRSRT